jgi:hypothetical protein
MTFEAKSTDQLVVVTLPSLQGASIEEFGLKLFNYWRLGQKDKNNGVLLFVAPNEQKVRIEVHDLAEREPQAHGGAGMPAFVNRAAEVVGHRKRILLNLRSARMAVRADYSFRPNPRSLTRISIAVSSFRQSSDTAAPDHAVENVQSPGWPMRRTVPESKF